MSLVASTILDLIKNMRAFGGILVVSLAARAGLSGEQGQAAGWAARAPWKVAAFRRKVPAFRWQRVTEAWGTQGRAGHWREELGWSGGRHGPTIPPSQAREPLGHFRIPHVS